MKINLGDYCKDTITGFKGVVVCISKWLHGCERITIQPNKMKDGKPIEQQTFDAPQLKVLRKNASLTTSDNGGPRPEPKHKINIR